MVLPVEIVCLVLRTVTCIDTVSTYGTPCLVKPQIPHRFFQFDVHFVVYDGTAMVSG
mgnify:CR=1 FL=1